MTSSSGTAMSTVVADTGRAVGVPVREPGAGLMLVILRTGPGFPVFAACVVAFLVYLWLPATMADPDIWWHLRNAEIQLETHHFLTHDVLSFTAAGAPWMDHEWLAELPYYLGWRLAGARGVYLVSLIAIEAILLGVFYRTYRSSRNAGAALVTSAIAALFATVSFGPRTLLFGWLCLTLELLILDAFRKDERWAWALPPLFAAWVNFHGSWVIGLVLLTVFAVCGWVRVDAGGLQQEGWRRWQARTLVLAGMASVTAVFVNPYGWRLVLYPFDLAFRQKLNVASVEEWRTLDFHSPRGRAMLLVLAALVLMQVVRRQRWRLHELAFTGIGVYAGCTYCRFLFLAGILMMPVLAKQIVWTKQMWRPEPSVPGGDRRWLNLLLLLAMIPIVVQRFPAPAEIETTDKSFPRQALPFLATFHPQGRVFNDFLWGGYLDWNARQVPVFIDSRVDIFEYNGSFRDYLDATTMKRPLEVLDRYGIRYVFFERAAPLVYLLKRTGEWKVEYEDDVSVLLERR